MSTSTAFLLLGLSLAFSLEVGAGDEASADKETGVSTTAETPAVPEHELVQGPQPPAGPTPQRSQIKPMVESAAKRHGVELALVKAVITAESAYNAHAISGAGAIGLMQLMPATAADYGVGQADKLFDPKVNLEAGIRHLKRLLAKYKNDYGRAIMAYNAGEGIVDRTNSNVTYTETLSYTEAVIKHYRRNGGTQPTDEALKKVRLLRSTRNPAKKKRLIARYLDLSLPALRIRHDRNIGSIDPGLDTNGPRSRPMTLAKPR